MENPGGITEECRRCRINDLLLDAVAALLWAYIFFMDFRVQSATTFNIRKIRDNW
jgi:hypothetical protein